MARGRLTPYRGAPRRRPRGRGLRGRKPSPLPFDSQAQRESGELGNEAADTLANLAAAYNRAQSQLGFGIGADSPYAASALNRDQLTTAQRGAVNGSGRQLYAGSTLNKLSAARGRYDRNQKQIEDEIAEAQSSFNQGTTQTQRDELLGRASIKAGAIERAAAQGPQPLGVGLGRGRGRGVSAPVARGRGRVPASQVQSARPGQLKALKEQAQRANAQIRARARGRR